MKAKKIVADAAAKMAKAMAVKACGAASMLSCIQSYSLILIRRFKS